MGVFNKNRRLAFLPSGNHLYLHFLVVVHWIIVLGNLSAMVAIPTLFLMGIVPWYYGFPLMTWLSVSACTRINCPFTNYENKIRKKLGKEPVGGFIKHYFYSPYVLEPKKKKMKEKGKK
jgi:hypothetical protein